MAYALIRYEVADSAVATITLDSPENRNALTNDLLRELLHAFESARDDERVRAWCSPRRTSGVFSAGGALDQFAAEVPLVHKHFATERFPELFKLIMQLGKPTICAANGHVLAGALGLALACDLVVAAEEALFGTPEINVGVFPFMIMALIYRNVPRKKTNELLLLGERISAGEAQQVGIVNKVVPAAELERAVDGLGRAARSEVAGVDEARQGRDVPSARHALRGGARPPALAAVDRLHDRGHPRGGAGLLREARSPVGRPMSAALVGLLCRTSDRTFNAARGVETLAPLLAKRLGRDPRMVGRPGGAYPGRFDDDLRDSRGCLLEAGARSTTRSRPATCRCCWPPTARSA